jgi:hypothetical protein
MVARRMVTQRVPQCSKCGRDILVQDEAWSFTAHKDSGAYWFHSRCNYPKHGGWPPPIPKDS